MLVEVEAATPPAATEIVLAIDGWEPLHGRVRTQSGDLAFHGWSGLAAALTAVERETDPDCP